MPVCQGTAAGRAASALFRKIAFVLPNAVRFFAPIAMGSIEGNQDMPICNPTILACSSPATRTTPRGPLVPQQRGICSPRMFFRKSHVAKHLRRNCPNCSPAPQDFASGGEQFGLSWPRPNAARLCPAITCTIAVLQTATPFLTTRPIGLANNSTAPACVGQTFMSASLSLVPRVSLGTHFREAPPRCLAIGAVPARQSLGPVGSQAEPWNQCPAGNNACPTYQIRPLLVISSISLIGLR
jgi:hypothetical protein